METIGEFWARQPKRNRPGGISNAGDFMGEQARRGKFVNKTSMDKIDKFMSANRKYLGLQKPLEAARVCDTARALANGRFEIVSYKEGLLTLGFVNAIESAHFNMASQKFIEELNTKLGDQKVKRIRYKIV